MSKQFNLNRIFSEGLTKNLRLLSKPNEKGIFGFTVEIYQGTNISVTRLNTYFNAKLDKAVEENILAGDDGYEIYDAIALEKGALCFVFLNNEARNAIEEVKSILKIDDTKTWAFDPSNARMGVGMHDSWIDDRMMNAFLFDAIRPGADLDEAAIDRGFRRLNDESFFHRDFGVVEKIQFAEAFLPNLSLFCAMANLPVIEKSVKAGTFYRSQLAEERIITTNDGKSKLELYARATPMYDLASYGTAVPSLLPYWVTRVVAEAEEGSDEFELTVYYVDDPYAGYRNPEVRSHGRHLGFLELTAYKLVCVPEYSETGAIQGIERIVVRSY